MARLAKYLVILVLTYSFLVLLTNGQKDSVCAKVVVPGNVDPDCTSDELPPPPEDTEYTSFLTCCKWTKQTRESQCCAVTDSSQTLKCPTGYSNSACKCRPLNGAPKGTKCTQAFYYGTSTLPSNAKTVKGCCKSAKNVLQFCCENGSCPSGFDTKCVNTAIG